MEYLMDPYVLGLAHGLLLFFGSGLAVSLINWLTERALYYRLLRKRMK